MEGGAAHLMRYGLGGFGGVGMLAGGLIMALMAAVMLALVVLAIIALVRYIRFSGRQRVEPAMQANPANNESAALTILNERFAKGEINEEEYTKKKEILRK